jgi:hypothetical protein
MGITRGIVAAGVVTSLVTSSAFAAATPKPGRFNGKDSQPGQTMTLVVKKGKKGKGRRVVKFEMTDLIVTCSTTSGSVKETLHFLKSGNFRVKKGRVKVEAPIHIKNTDGTSRISSGHGSMRVRFTSKKKAKGSVSFSWTYNQTGPSGFQGASCKSGKITFKVKHA